MSQLTVISALPLGRRIVEIMDEKGAAFSQRAFAPRVGFSKDTLGRVIAGERNIKPSELRRIADGLSITVARLKQEDTAAATNELLDRLEGKKDLKRALQLAEKVHAVSLGVTEKCDSALYLARTKYALGDIEQAHRLFLQAYEEANRLYEKYGETDRLYNTLSKLMTTFTVRKQFSKLSEILAQMETVFEAEPEKQGSICFSKAMIAEHFGNVEQTRENLYKSLEYYSLTCKKNDIGRAECNAGFFEFKQGNYKKAKKLLEDAIQSLDGDLQYQLIAIKEYAKTLIKLEECEHAASLLQEKICLLEERPELRAKFLLLISIATGDIADAESIFSIEKSGQKVLRLACKFLTKHYIALGDSEAVLKYAVINEGLSINNSDIIHEEDL